MPASFIQSTRNDRNLDELEFICNRSPHRSVSRLPQTPIDWPETERAVGEAINQPISVISLGFAMHCIETRAAPGARAASNEMAVLSIIGLERTRKIQCWRSRMFSRFSTVFMSRTNVPVPKRTIVRLSKAAWSFFSDTQTRPRSAIYGGGATWPTSRAPYVGQIRTDALDRFQYHCRGHNSYRGMLQHGEQASDARSLFHRLGSKVGNVGQIAVPPCRRSTALAKPTSMDRGSAENSRVGVLAPADCRW